MRPPRLLVRLAASLMLVMLGSCATEPTTPPAATPDASLGSLPIVGELLACDPLPYAETTKVIDRSGGVIYVGPHRLIVPPGSLRDPVTITAQAPVGTSRTVRLLPEGLEFRYPAVLTMSYEDCSLVTRLLPKRIAYTTEGLSILEMLRSYDDWRRQQVSATLDHFSRYAVAW